MPAGILLPQYVSCLPRYPIILCDEVTWPYPIEATPTCGSEWGKRRSYVWLVRQAVFVTWCLNRVEGGKRRNLPWHSKWWWLECGPVIFDTWCCYLIQVLRRFQYHTVPLSHTHIYTQDQTRSSGRWDLCTSRAVEVNTALKRFRVS